MGIKKMLVGITMGIIFTTSFAWDISDISAASNLLKENVVDPAMEINEQKRYDKLMAEQREEERAQEERERRELLEMNERNEKERLAMEERQREKDRELQLKLAEIERKEGI